MVRIPKFHPGILTNIIRESNPDRVRFPNENLTFFSLTLKMDRYRLGELSFCFLCFNGSDVGRRQGLRKNPEGSGKTTVRTLDTERTVTVQTTIFEIPRRALDR